MRHLVVVESRQLIVTERTVAGPGGDAVEGIAAESGDLSARKRRNLVCTEVIAGRSVDSGRNCIGRDIRDGIGP